MYFDIETIVSLSILVTRYKLTRSGNLIFHTIIEELHANEGYLKNEEIIKKTGKCEKTVSTAIDELRNKNLIDVENKNGKNYYTCIFLEELNEIFIEVCQKEYK